jgi:hypothetical protein
MQLAFSLHVKVSLNLFALFFIEAQKRRANYFQE